jgi:SanA protein
MKCKITYTVLILLTALISAIFVADFLVRNNAKGRLYADVDDIPKHKVGLLLGTAKYVAQGQVNLYYQYRVDAAVALYNAGKIEFILVSGDNSTMSYNEPTQFKKDLISRGVPEEKIFLDYAGFRTLDSVVRAKMVFGETEFIIISQQFHNERALYLADKKGVNAIAFNARDVDKQSGIRVKFREYIARSKMFLDLTFGKQPKFLGEKIEIN